MIDASELQLNQRSRTRQSSFMATRSGTRQSSVGMTACTRSLATSATLATIIAFIAVDEALAQLAVEVQKREAPVDFQKEILPILKSSCLACHNASEAEGDLVLETPAAIRTGGLSGPAVVEGNSDESLLFQAASHSGDVMMPPEQNAAGAKNLTPEQLGLLKLWIDQGARESESVADAAIGWQPLAGDVDPIYAVAITPHGRYVAAGWGNRLLVYQIATQRLVVELVDPSLGEHFDATSRPRRAAHLDLIQSLAISPDGERLASGGFRTVKVWHKRFPAAIRLPLDAFDGLPPEVATGTLKLRWRDNLVEIVQAGASDVVRTFDFGRSVSLAAVSGDGTRVAAIGAGGPARLWNAEDGEVIAELHGNLLARDRAADAERIAGIRERQRDQAQRDLEAAQKEKEEAQEQIKQAKAEVETAEKALGEKRAAEEEKLAAKTAAEEKAAAAEAEKAGVDEAKKAMEEATKAAEEATKEHDQAERALQAAKDAVERNGPALARAEATIEDAKVLLAAATEAFEAAAAARDAAQQQLSQAVTEPRAVAFSPDGKEVAVADAAGTLSTYACADGSPLEEIETGVSEPRKIEYVAANTVRLLTSDGALEVATLPTWELERTIGSLGSADVLVDRVTALDFAPDGTQLAAGSGEPSRSGELKIFDAATGEMVRSIDQPHSDTVLSLAFSPDGARLASGGADRFAKVFDAKSGAAIKTLEGHTGHVLSIAWHAVGRIVATASADNTIKVWDWRTAEQQKTIDGFDAPLNSVAFVGTDDTCVVGGKDLVTSRKTDGDGGPTYDGAKDVVHAVDATPDGKLIAAGGQDGHLRVWKAEGEAVATFAPHKVISEEEGKR
jgi:WD40 repeat protein